MQCLHETTINHFHTRISIEFPTRRAKRSGSQENRVAVGKETLGKQDRGHQPRAPREEN